MNNQKYIANFSCGAASATATKLAICEFGKENVRVCYQDTRSEHPDNERFFKDCEAWFGVKIERFSSDKYHDVDDVIEKTKYIAGAGGARCTAELKRKVAESIINFGPDQEIEIMGYTIEERDRVDRFIKNNNERKLLAILVDRGLTKEDCLGFVDRAGIELPIMYKLGYQNNNCLGCVKGQAGYWNKIKIDFPDVFDRRARQERTLNAAINKRYESITLISAESELSGNDLNIMLDKGKVIFNGDSFTLKGSLIEVRRRVFLDELPPNMGNHLKEPTIQCGLICMAEHDSL